MYNLGFMTQWKLKTIISKLKLKYFNRIEKFVIKLRIWIIPMIIVCSREIEKHSVRKNLIYIFFWLKIIRETSKRHKKLFLHDRWTKTFDESTSKTSMEMKMTECKFILSSVNDNCKTKNLKVTLFCRRDSSNSHSA